MKRIILVTTFLMIGFSGFSQSMKPERPDYEQMEKRIADAASDLYYPKLLIRFKMADSTMTLEEKRHLYYGFSFQDEYAPYVRSNYEDSLRNIFQRKKLETADYYNIVKFSDSILFQNPFNLAVIDNALYAHDKLGDVERFNENIIQMRIVIDALLSSGDGLSKKTAFYVIATSHEYFLLNVLGYSFGGEQSLIEHYDYLKLAKNTNKIKGLYFDVSRCLNALSKGYK